MEARLTTFPPNSTLIPIKHYKWFSYCFLPQSIYQTWCLWPFWYKSRCRVNSPGLKLFDVVPGIFCRMLNGCQTPNWLWCLVIRVRKLSESDSTWGHYTGKTDQKLDSLRFLTLINKLHSHSAAVRHSAKYPCHWCGILYLFRVNVN